jgi:endonuclease I
MSLLALLVFPVACVDPTGVDAQEMDEALVARLDLLEDVIITFVNDASLDELDDDVGLDVRAAYGIVSRREQAPIKTMQELDAVPYVGPSALRALAAYVEEVGLYVADRCAPRVLGYRECGPRATAILELISTADLAELDCDAALDKRAATRIYDLCAGSADGSSCPTTLEELDAVGYVGQSAMDHLVEYVEAIKLPQSIFYRDIEPSVGLEIQLRQRMTEWHYSLEYGDVWGAFEQFENDPAYTPDCTGFYDFYGETCWESLEDRCGNYKGEGECFNREHSWPKSWWGGTKDVPQYTDLHHLYPTDGYVNMKRASHPLGRVSKPTIVSSNGSKVGLCTVEGVGTTCFEPIDAHKGDLARTYFYFSIRYRDDETPSTVATTGGSLNPETEDMLRQWHVQDPVSADELHRNRQIFLNFQNTLNPFVDHPEWVDQVSDF